MYSGEHYRLFLEDAPDAFFAHDAQGHLIDVNRQACLSLGYSREELLALLVFDIDASLEPQRARQIWAALEPGKTALVVSQHRRKDGSEFPVEAHVGMLSIGGHKILFGLARDISERIHSERRQARLTQLYSALSEVNQMIVREPEPGRMFQHICQIAVEYGGMSMAWMGQLQPGTDRVIPIASYGEGVAYLDGIDISINPDEPAGQGLTGRAFRARAHCVINNFATDASIQYWHEQRSLYRWQSSGAFAIACGGATQLVLSVYHKDVDAFDEEIIGLLDEMAIDIGFALDNFDKEKKRELAEKTIREQNNFLQAIFDSEPECVKILSPDGRLMRMNRAGLEMLEVDSTEQVDKIDLLGFVAPEYRAGFAEFHNYICTGNSGHFEFRIKGRKGTERWLETHGTALRDGENRIIAHLGVTRDVTDKKRFDQLIWQKANFDQLTGLPNRNMFQDRLRHELKLAARSGDRLAVLFIDLDHFKEVNDTLGHHTGDLLLVEVAQRITGCVRESDTVARLGGDEFMVILPGFLGDDVPTGVAEKLIQQLSAPFRLSESLTETHVTASIGITQYPSDGDNTDQLMRNVDQAMYVAKAQGRNCFAWFTPVLREQSEHRQSLLQDLRHALANKQFSLCFQPIVELANGRVVKVEALLRWQHPQRGAVSPAEFIPLAEESGLIVEIGRWVMLESLKWAQHWVRAGASNVQVSVNVSPVQLQRTTGRVELLFQILREAGLEPRHLAMEITEGLLLHASQDIQSALDRLRQGGIKLAIDDFGTGYSALSYLKKFDIDYLKIDRSFIRDLEDDPSDRALSEAIIVMAHKLGLKVIAEGVETQGQRDLLIAAGCDYAQGFFFAKPLPPEEIETLLLAKTTIPHPSAL